MSFVHEGKKQSYLHGLNLYVANLIDEKAVVGDKLFHEFCLGTIGQGFIKGLDEFGKQDKSPAVSVIDGLEQKGGGQAGLAGAGGTNEDEVLPFCHVGKGIV